MTSVELTTALFTRADAHDATLGTYVVRFDDTALAAAAQAVRSRLAVRRRGQAATS